MSFMVLLCHLLGLRIANISTNLFILLKISLILGIINVECDMLGSSSYAFSRICAVCFCVMSNKQTISGPGGTITRMVHGQKKEKFGEYLQGCYLQWSKFLIRSASCIYKIRGTRRLSQTEVHCHKCLWGLIGLPETVGIESSSSVTWIRSAVIANTTGRISSSTKGLVHRWIGLITIHRYI